MGKKRNAYRDLVGKTDEREPFGTGRCRWKDYIKTDLTELGCVDRIRLPRIRSSNRLLQLP
jgi:hypothetical protein